MLVITRVTLLCGSITANHEFDPPVRVTDVQYPVNFSQDYHHYHHLQNQFMAHHTVIHPIVLYTITLPYCIHNYVALLMISKGLDLIHVGYYQGHYFAEPIKH